MQKWFFSFCLVIIALAVAHRPAVSSEPSALTQVEEGQCLTVEDLNSDVAKFCQETCCTSEFNNPDLAYLCTQEGTCCDPEGCECGVYKLIEYGERCELEK